MSISTMLSTPWGKLAFLDVLIIATYMLFCLYIGFRKAGKISNIKEFALGNGQVSTFLLVATIYATHLGAGMTFGTIEKMHELGLLFALSVIISPIGWLITVLIFGRNIANFKGCISLSDIMGKLYGSTGKWITNIVSIIVSIGNVAAQASALGYLMHYFLDWDLASSIFIGISVLIIYSTFGGVRAVALTDVIQFIIFYIAIPYLCAAGFHKVGGFIGMANSVPVEKLQLTWSYDTITLLIGFLVYSLISYGRDGPIIQRFLMANDTRQLISALKVVIGLDLVMSMLLCLLGFIILAAIPTIPYHNTIFLTFITGILPVGATGIVVTGLIAVIMSTADSWLNTASVLCAHDIAKKIWPELSHSGELFIARSATLVVGILAIILALNAKGILEIIWLISNFYIPIVFIPLVAGFLNFRTNTESFIVSVGCAVIVTLCGAYTQSEFNLISLTLGLIGSALGLFGAHYFQLYTGRLERRVPPVEEEPAPSLLTRTTLLLRKLAKMRVKDIIDEANKETELYPPRYYNFAILGLAYCLLPLLLAVAAGNGISAPFSTRVILHGIAVAGCVTLLFHELWPAKFRERYLSIYWFGLLLYALPTLGIYDLVWRQGDLMWVMHAITAAFMLVAFLENRACIVLTGLGLISGSLLAWVLLPYGMILLPNIGQELGTNLILGIYIGFISILAKELVQRVQEARSTAMTDRLTTLYNRHYLEMRMNSIITHALLRQSSLTILVLDIDHFKEVNDTYGHLSGDVILRELGRRLKDSVRPEDTCARWGGEEFIVVMPGADMKHAEVVAERLRKKVADVVFAIPVAPKSITCTISIGVSELCPEDDVDALIQRADEALYQAKETGRNRVFAMPHPAKEELVAVQAG